MAKKRERWVIKAGSQSVCEGGPVLIRSWMQQLLTLRRKHGVEVIWVTSGAIASAVDRTGFTKRNRDLKHKQALSAIGQPLVMDLYNLCLGAVGMLGAQVLLTADDLGNAKRRKNLQNSLETLLSWDVIPILNENDAVATDEIKFGDNDALSAKVAKAMKADRLVILTDVDGLYDQDPKKARQPKRIGKLPKVTQKILAQVGQGAGSRRGTGGMSSKLLAAQDAGRARVETWLVRGDLPGALIQVAENRDIGTRIG